MERVRSFRDAEPIAEALSWLPRRMERLVRGTAFFAGADPVFAGLHRFEACSFSRSYRDTAHFCWPMHLAERPRSERVGTVVLPVPVSPVTVLHELGHALHSRLGQDVPIPGPVSWYAETDCWEAFAEAVTVLVAPPEHLPEALYGNAERALASDESGPFMALWREVVA